MTDTENVFDGFALLGDDEEFDVDKIFGSGSDEPAPPPPAPTLAEEVKPQFNPEQVQTETAESQPEPEQTLPAKTQEAPAEEKQPLELFSAFTGAESDPIPEAALVKSIAPRPQTQLSLFDKPPVFQYGGAREQITDPDMTFEALRIQKADDFPELEDASAVTWQVRYGDVTKTVPAPKTDTIAAMKAEIEKSKAFLDSLKKGKVKDPECVVKPQIRMQKKGIADYKGVFPTLEAARASNKVICLIPSRDGQTYEMRRSELGEFIAPKHKITEFSEVRAGFRPALPRIPQELLRSIIGFFRSQMELGAEFEALVRIYWDRKEQKFIPFVPKQRVTKDRVTVRLTDEDLPDDTRYLYYADIHSHNSMKAVFSAIDDMDERGTRLYLVIGQTFSDGSFVYTTEPFLICLPNLDEKTDTWQYDVTVSPKHTRTPIPVVPPDDTDKRKVLKVWNDAGQEHDPTLAGTERPPSGKNHGPAAEKRRSLRYCDPQ